MWLGLHNSLSHQVSIVLLSDYLRYTSSLKIGTPKNREFRKNLAFFKTSILLKIGNFKKSVTLAIPEFKRTSVCESYCTVRGDSGKYIEVMAKHSDGY